MDADINIGQLQREDINKAALMERKVFGGSVGRNGMAFVK